MLFASNWKICLPCLTDCGLTGWLYKHTKGTHSYVTGCWSFSCNTELKITCNCRDLQLSHFIAPASSLVRRTCGETLPAGRCPGWWKRLCTRGRRRSSNWTRPRAGWAAARTPAPAAPRRVPGDRSRAASTSTAAARWRLSAGRGASWRSAGRQVSSEDLSVGSLCVGRRRKGGTWTHRHGSNTQRFLFFFTLKKKWHRKNMQKERLPTICWQISNLAALFFCCCVANCTDRKCRRRRFRPPAGVWWTQAGQESQHGHQLPLRHSVRWRRAVLPPPPVRRSLCRHAAHTACCDVTAHRSVLWEAETVSWLVTWYPFSFSFPTLSLLRADCNTDRSCLIT